MAIDLEKIRWASAGGIKTDFSTTDYRLYGYRIIANKGQRIVLNYDNQWRSKVYELTKAVLDGGYTINAILKTASGANITAKEYENQQKPVNYAIPAASTLADRDSVLATNASVLYPDESFVNSMRDDIYKSFQESNDSPYATSQFGTMGAPFLNSRGMNCLLPDGLVIVGGFLVNDAGIHYSSVSGGLYNNYYLTAYKTGSSQTFRIRFPIANTDLGNVAMDGLYYQPVYVPSEDLVAFLPIYLNYADISSGSVVVKTTPIFWWDRQTNQVGWANMEAPTSGVLASNVAIVTDWQYNPYTNEAFSSAILGLEPQVGGFYRVNLCDLRDASAANPIELYHHMPYPNNGYPNGNSPNLASGAYISCVYEPAKHAMIATPGVDYNNLVSSGMGDQFTFVANRQGARIDLKANTMTAVGLYSAKDVVWCMFESAFYREQDGKIYFTGRYNTQPSKLYYCTYDTSENLLYFRAEAIDSPNGYDTKVADTNRYSFDSATDLVIANDYFSGSLEFYNNSKWRLFMDWDTKLPSAYELDNNANMFSGELLTNRETDVSGQTNTPFFAVSSTVQDPIKNKISQYSKFPKYYADNYSTMLDYVVTYMTEGSSTTLEVMADQRTLKFVKDPSLDSTSGYTVIGAVQNLPVGYTMQILLDSYVCFTIKEIWSDTDGVYITCNGDVSYICDEFGDYNSPGITSDELNEPVYETFAPFSTNSPYSRFTAEQDPQAPLDQAPPPRSNQKTSLYTQTGYGDYRKKNTFNVFINRYSSATLESVQAPMYRAPYLRGTNQK